MLLLLVMCLSFTPHSESLEGRIVLLFSFIAHALIRVQCIFIAINGVEVSMKERSNISRMTLGRSVRIWTSFGTIMGKLKRL